MESIYCEICGSCGEEGCCPASMCRQHKDGKYCRSHLDYLKFAYYMFMDTYGLLEKHCPEELGRIYDENYELIYKNK